MELRDDFAALMLADTPLLDVRAPLEFAKGAFPNAVNVPLLNDIERAKVGTAYKRDGHDAAVSLGHQLVKGEVKASRIAEWLSFTRNHPEGALYCFRGGERSAIVQQWLAEAGTAFPRIRGGYKAMRRFLMSRTEALCQDHALTLLAGRTGVAKTELLAPIPHAIDLEGLANHRGSAFGRRPGGQPSVIDFEHRLAIAWMKIDAAGHRHVAMEDESRCIGSCALPEPLWNVFQSAPLVLLEASMEDRVATIRADYVEGLLQEYQTAQPDNAFESFTDHFLGAVDRIQRRLGGARHANLRAAMESAFAEHARAGNACAHDDWITTLMGEYYDPMYDYQLAKKADRIVFRGDRKAVRAYLNELPTQAGHSANA